MRDIRTKRLLLRAPCLDDFEAIKSIYSRPEVARMVANWPLPADDEFVASRCMPMPSGKSLTFVIVKGAEVIGTIGAKQGDSGDHILGYALHPNHWGNGIATEAATAVVARTFQNTDAHRIIAGVWNDNQSSGRVLSKTGFRFTHVGLGWCEARQDTLPAHLYEQTRVEWVGANPLRIKTDRMTIRGFEFQDAVPLAKIASDPDVARMVSAYPPDVDLKFMTEAMVARRYKGVPGFSLAICDKEDRLIGTLGIAPKAKDIFYILGREN